MSAEGGRSVELSAGLVFSDRIEALLDGRLQPRQSRLAIDLCEPQALFRAVLRDAAYDVAEFSLASHVVAVASGNTAYTGLPVFLSRAFRHGNVFVRGGAGITCPGDLAGRRVGLADFHQTAAVWVRGLLADEHGVDRRSVHWVTAGLSTPMAESRARVETPPGIVVERHTRTLNELLEEGGIDALISPVAPRSFSGSDGAVKRLWPDYRQEERAWFERTRLFPIMHLLVVRRSILDAHPDLAADLVEAFTSSHALAVRDLDGRDYPKIATPWLRADREDTLAALGGDPWTHGIDRNLPELSTLLRYAEADGLSHRRLAVAELFHPFIPEPEP